jgi:hypothetical protein
VALTSTTWSDPFGDSGRKPAAAANRVDGAGNRICGDWSAAGRRSVTCGGFRRLRRGFPSHARDAPLQRFASAAGFRPILLEQK